ncbi:UvrD-helicase domain-containing protein [Caldibacillus lycopersici]|uniref:UvrD-helicase domain-containing protein n=1 Tax=Perspicuibacillus lycopersici TaxID=1325689 RepID=A0AAE3IXB0_9BACI|nr:RNA polymerase recycling motor HelD [Perspicuibacillus lycopersici]MCU9615094.1 UvrD-helicase domain-containing protein [Perspicuibacillus lycopersici]
MAENKDLTKEIEQSHVDNVIHVIEKKLTRMEEKTGTLKQDIVSLRKTFWEDVTVNLDEPDDVIETHTSIRQQSELLSERERSHRQLYKQWNNLTRLKSSPFFGRIDFKEDGEERTEKIYIGLFSLMDEQDEEFLVYDWRAPISSMYYDYAPGPAKYETMDGFIHGEMELKRQYIIRDGKIKVLFDTGVTIGDEMLQEVLSDQADTQMKSIVATIQREQNEIIRNDEKKYLIVQGSAGSGKTSAALQRVAYLLYRYRKKLRADNILLFSPNPMFNSYVANVLPELGEENMQQSTFFQYLLHRLDDDFIVEDPNTQIEYMLSTNRDAIFSVRKAGILYKASIAFKQMIDQYVLYLNDEGMQFKNITFRKEKFINKEEIEQYFYSLDRSISIPNRIIIVKDWLLLKLKEKEQEERPKEWVEEERELLEREDYLKVYKKLQKEQRFTDDTFNDFDREEKLLAEWIVRKRIKPLRRKIESLAFIDLPTIYRNIFAWALQSDFPNLPDCWQEIGEETGNELKNRQLNYEDATPFLYIKDKLEGKHIYSGIRHLFIDEAQDYSPFQFAYIKEIFPNSKMTILGDINQSIYSHSTNNESGLAKSDSLFPLEEQKKIVLTKSYRSTKQIVEFSEMILTDRPSIEPFNRNGSKPMVAKVNNVPHLNEKIVEQVRKLQSEGKETIAIICKTAKETLAAYQELSKQLPMHLIQKETHSYEKGLLIIPSYLAKGIEFDAVIIYNGSSDVYHEEDERKLFYTACTRAMHSLTLFYIGEKSPFLQKVDTSKYEEVSFA